MTDLSSLYRLAEEKNIDIDYIPMGRAQSLSMPLSRRRYGVAIDPRKLAGRADERVKLCHELGHCVTGSFYNRHAALDLRARHELHADRWAIGQLVPRGELEEALQKGIREVWELAEHFVVTEAFMKKALAHYHLLDDEE